MAEPKRIQLSRQKGWRMPDNTVKVDRSTMFGNPFPADIYGRDGAVDRFRRWITGNMSAQETSTSSRNDRWSVPPGVSLSSVRRWLLDDLSRLCGKNLACWCPLPKDGEPDLCHGAVLLELSNRRPDHG